MKFATFLQLLGLLATLGFTTAKPLEATKGAHPLNYKKFHRNVEKWNEGKDLAAEVIYLMTELSRPNYSFEYSNKLTRHDFEELVERYFGVGSWPAVDNVIFPMFARMLQGLELGHDSPLKYQYDTDNRGFSGSAYTSKEVISFANQGLIEHPFVDKVPERARVWIHEMSHLAWVNGGIDGGVHDTPIDSIEYSTHSLQQAAKPLGSVYGETLGQYLAYCYPNKAPFNSDNVARFAMAVYHAAEHGHKPDAAAFQHKCPASQGENPYFSLPPESIPHISSEIGGPVGHGNDLQTVSGQVMPHRRTVSLDDHAAAPTIAAAMPERAEKVSVPRRDLSLEEGITATTDARSGDKLRRGPAEFIPIRFDEETGKWVEDAEKTEPFLP